MIPSRLRSQPRAFDRYQPRASALLSRAVAREAWAATGSGVSHPVWRAKMLGANGERLGEVGEDLPRAVLDRTEAIPCRCLIVGRGLSGPPAISCRSRSLS